MNDDDRAVIYAWMFGTWLCLMVIMCNSGCAAPQDQFSTVRWCEGHPKAATERLRHRHACHLGDDLDSYRRREWAKIRDYQTTVRPAR